MLLASTLVDGYGLRRRLRVANLKFVFRLSEAPLVQQHGGSKINGHIEQTNFVRWARRGLIDHKREAYFHDHSRDEHCAMHLQLSNRISRASSGVSSGRR
jgi:hypothetical protein